MAANQNIICIQSRAFYALIDEVVSHIDTRYGLQKESKWIDADASMALLNITSRTTLQTLRDTGKIRFSKTSPKNILYDKDSILKHIEGKAQETF